VETGTLRAKRDYSISPDTPSYPGDAVDTDTLLSKLLKRPAPVQRREIWDSEGKAYESLDLT
jgi:hypothetical protein